jgi:Mrp family chromosome partitioning ATPase
VEDAADLRGLLKVLRKQRVVVVLTVLVAVGATIAYTTRQSPRYVAKSALAFRDESQDLAALGAPAPPVLQPDQVAAAQQDKVTQEPVPQRVKRKLRSRLSEQQLIDAIDTSVDPASGLVIVTAKARSGRAAAELANTFASQTQRVVTRADRVRYAAAATRLERQLRRAKRTDLDTATRVIYADRISRLVALSTFARPVEVQRVARVPSSPASPKPVRDTLLAALLGLVVGLLLAFARNAIDRRLRSSAEVSDQIEIPLLGHVRTKSLGVVGKSMSGHRLLDDAELEAFRIVRLNLEFLDVDTPKRTVLITSSLPEEGKSTVSAALAFATAAAGKRTLLLECDLRRPSLSDRLAIAPSPGLTDHLEREASLDQVTQTITFLQAESPNGKGVEASNGTEPRRVKLTCITAGTPTAQCAEVLGGVEFRDFLVEVRDAYDAIIIDSSPLLPVVDTREILPLVDAVVLCVRASRTTREQLLATTNALGQLPKRPTGLVVTGTHKGDEGEYGAYGYAYQHARRAPDRA